MPTNGSAVCAYIIQRYRNAKLELTLLWLFSSFLYLAFALTFLFLKGSFSEAPSAFLGLSRFELFFTVFLFLFWLTSNVRIFFIENRLKADRRILLNLFGDENEARDKVIKEDGDRVSESSTEMYFFRIEGAILCFGSILVLILI